MKPEATLELGGHVIELSNLDKVLYPDAGYTKGEVVDYYRRMADRMVPHARERPVSMQRFPDGIDGEGFYQKQVPEYFPDWIETVRVEKEEGENRQLMIQDAATLVYLAQQACLTPHLWLSRRDRLNHPDRMIFDLDPPDDGKAGFDGVREAARHLRDLLVEVELPSFVATTGSSGLHVYVPLDRSADFDAVRAVARGVAEAVAARHPGALTTAVRKANREGRVFLDYLRNARAQTAVAPYALRALPGAPVCTPLDWDELGEVEDARAWTLENIFRRLGQKEDPFRGMAGAAVSLEGVSRRLEILRDDRAGASARD